MRKRKAPRRPHRLRYQLPTTPAQRMLRRAHHSMELGEHANAAALFEKMAREAHDHNKLHQAPRLYLQAARGYVLAGDILQAEAQLWLGLEILIRKSNWAQVHLIGQRVIHELEEWGQPKLAQNVEKWLEESLPKNYILTQHGQVTPHHMQLPLKCPSCGGAILQGEVEWQDSNTGECPYCGTAIRGKKP